MRIAVGASGGRLRVELTACLASLGDKRSIAALQRLKVKGPQLTLLVARTLAGAGAGASVRSTLHSVFDHATMGSQRWRDAGDGLIALADAQARQLLAAELTQPDQSRVVGAARILLRHGDQQAMRRLEQIATGPPSPMRAEAAVVVAGRQNLAALQFARAGLHSDRPRLRSHAIAVVARLGQQAHKDFLPHVARMASRDPSVAVRATALAALASSGGRT